mmetsp:Transcript_9648/g.16205  ORF Transcript_9648/g.16205 Transcript_9648/m.16205 type:complete len:88 (+) Transcript_9648:494-757(+)
MIDLFKKSQASQHHSRFEPKNVGRALFNEVGEQELMARQNQSQQSFALDVSAIQPMQESMDLGDDTFFKDFDESLNINHAYPLAPQP